MKDFTARSGPMLQGTAGADGVAVYLELGVKRVFACALDWPGWCRSGRTEDQALEALAAYAPRYAAIAAEGGLRLPPPRFEIVERLAGSATTDSAHPTASRPVTAPPRRRRTAIE